MTIAAGFRFHGGLLLCADTQHTSPGYMKLEATKIVPIDLVGLGGAQVVFVITGSVHYANMAIERCMADLRQRKPDDLTLNGIRQRIEGVLTDFHAKVVYPHPEFHKAGGPDFQLLIGIYSPIERSTLLLETNDSAVTEVARYECLGAGSFLGHYLVPQFYRHTNMALKDVVNVAVHVLRETKRYVDTCGGGSEFIALLDDGGFSAVKWFDISTGEAISEAFKELLAGIFLGAADLDSTDEHLKEQLDTFFMVLKATRDSQRLETDKQRKLYESLARARRLARQKTQEHPEKSS